MSAPTLANARSVLVSVFQPLERKLTGLFGLKSRARELLAAQSARTFLSGELALDPPFMLAVEVASTETGLFEQ